MDIITNNKALREKQVVIYWIEVAFYIIGLLCHMTGFLALYRYKRKTNQNAILFCISLVETILIIVGIIIRTDEHYVNYCPKQIDVVMDGIEESVIFQLVLTMYVLTVDRFICVLDPLRYNLRVTRKKLIVSIVLTWFGSLVLAVLSKTLISKLANIVYYIFIAIAVSYALVAISTYSYILYVVRKSTERFKSQAQPRKQFLIPGLIILTFFIFYFIPFCIQRLELMRVIYPEATYEEYYLRYLICQAFQILGLVADSLIYIIFTKHYRDAVFSLCKKKKHNRKSLEKTSHSSFGSNITKYGKHS